MKVLYVGGKGRSGSTLLDRLLGQLDGFFSTGELHRVWTWGWLAGARCGCGVPVPSCEVWSAVAADPALAPWSPARVAGAAGPALRWARLAALLTRRPGGVAPSRAVRDYAAAMAALYRAVARVTGARVIVDSSKHPAHPGPLGLVPGVRGHVVHLVRDPRAVAHSWRRPRSFEGAGAREAMPTHAPLHSAASWLVRNAAMEALRPRYPAARWLRLRYEDLVAHPRPALQRLTAMVGEHPTRLPLPADRTAELAPTHAVGGNPGKFRSGQVPLHDDDEWRTALPAAQRWLVTAVDLPLLGRYGYRPHA
ncbi:MAG: sulfotransferase [Actinobacteria bacterium]|nr:sulfotransferase [Actinomycetota bacterium]